MNDERTVLNEGTLQRQGVPASSLDKVEVGLGAPAKDPSTRGGRPSKMSDETKRKSIASVEHLTGLDEDENRPLGSLFALKKARAAKKIQNIRSESRAEKPIVEELGSAGLEATLASLKKRLKTPKKVKDISGSVSCSVPSADLTQTSASPPVKKLTLEKLQTSASRWDLTKNDGDDGAMEVFKRPLGSSNSSPEDYLSSYVKRIRSNAVCGVQSTKKQRKRIASTSAAKEVAIENPDEKKKCPGRVRRGRKSAGGSLADLDAVIGSDLIVDQASSAARVVKGISRKTRHSHAPSQRGGMSQKSDSVKSSVCNMAKHSIPEIGLDSDLFDNCDPNRSPNAGLDFSAVSGCVLEIDEIHAGSDKYRGSKIVSYVNECTPDANEMHNEHGFFQVKEEKLSLDDGLKHCSNVKMPPKHEFVELSLRDLYLETTDEDFDQNPMGVKSVDASVKEEDSVGKHALTQISCSGQPMTTKELFPGSLDTSNRLSDNKFLSVSSQMLQQHETACLLDSKFIDTCVQASKQNVVIQNQCITVPHSETVEKGSNDSGKLNSLSEETLNATEQATISSSLNCMVVLSNKSYLDQSVRGGSANQLLVDASNEQALVVTKGLSISNVGEAALQIIKLNSRIPLLEQSLGVSSAHQSAVLHAMRNAKKRKHDDMAYEGDDDWEVLMHEPEIFTNSSIRDCQSTTMLEKPIFLGVKCDVSDGGAAAVAAGLKAHAAIPLEKLKFKEVFKRKGGFSEYMECRNLILQLWSKDVNHILTFEDCGVSNSTMENDPTQVSLLRDIFRFLDEHGYINSGIAADRRGSTKSPLRDCGVPIELTRNGTCCLSISSSEEEAASIIAHAEGSDNPAASVNKFSCHNRSRKSSDKEVSAGKEHPESSIGSELSRHADIGEQVSGIVELTFAKRNIPSSDLLDDGTNLEGTCIETEDHDKATSFCVSQPQRGRDGEDGSVLDATSANIILDQQGEVHVSTRQSKTKGNGNDESFCLRKFIIIVGAGPAGLTAARHLQRLGYSVIVLEARGRIGGRVFTDHTSLSVPVDLGASIITGVQADIATERRPDPSSLICAQLGLELTVLNSDCPLYDIVTGNKVPIVLDEALEAEYNSLLDDTLCFVSQHGENAMAMSLEDGLEYALSKRRMAQLTPNDRKLEQVGVISDWEEINKLSIERKNEPSGNIDVVHKSDILSPLERRVMDWHFANLEYGCAAPLKEVSLPYWNQDDVYGGFGGAHCMIKGGYGTVLDHLFKGIDVRLNHVVTEISYEDSDLNEIEKRTKKVRVRTSSGEEFSADAVLITVPLGCLKANTISFSPALPDWKESSIQRLGFGVLNKVVLEFPNVFWEETVDYFGATAEDSNSRGHCFMFWNVKKTVGAPVLIALVVGKAAVYGQNISSEDHINRALMVLRKLFGESSVPDPVAYVVTNWGLDPFSRGAYSFVAVGASGEDYDILGRPVANCIFFAGEATCKEHPDTVGGAMMSGLREAIRINDILSTGKDYFMELEAMEDDERSDNDRNELWDLSKKLDACMLSHYDSISSANGAHKLLAKGSLLQNMFTTAKTTSGRLHLAKEMLALPVEALKSFAGTREGLSILNSWILDSLGKNATQLLRHCVRLLVIVSTDLLAVKLSGIGRTIKEKVCVHTSRDIRGIASQLVGMWIGVFRKEKAANGRLKLLRQTATSESSKVKTKDQTLGNTSCTRRESMDRRGILSLDSPAGSCSPSKANIRVSDKPDKIGSSINKKLENPQSTFQNVDSKMADKAVISEQETQAFAAAEAAHTAAVAVAKAYASETETNTFRELPKIPSFHKFARREQNVQMDDSDIKKKWSGGVLGKQDCMSEIDSRNCRVRDWSLDFTTACRNLERTKLCDGVHQCLSNEIACPLNLGEHSGESGTMDSRLTKAWVDTDTASNGGVKDSTAIERWQLQAMDADAEFYWRVQLRDEQGANKTQKLEHPQHRRPSEEIANLHNVENKSSCEGHPRGVDHVKQGVVDYVTSLLMPLYKARKIDKEGYKSIMKKTATKVIEQCTEAEKGMSAFEFLDFKRKNKIRAFVDKLIERHMTMKPPSIS